MRPIQLNCDAIESTNVPHVAMTNGVAGGNIISMEFEFLFELSPILCHVRMSSAEFRYGK